MNINLLSRDRKKSGWTINEIIVGLVILGILAAIAVPSYLMISKHFQQESLKSDLLLASTKVDEAKLDNGGKYPLQVPSGLSLKNSDAKLDYSYPYTRLEYCLSISSADGQTTYYKSSKNTDISETNCKYEYSIPSTKLTGTMDGYTPKLSWNTVPNATSYEIYKDNSLLSTVKATSTGDTQSLSVEKLSPAAEGTYYIIVATNNKKSAPSNAVHLKAPAPAPTTPKIELVDSQVKDATNKTFTIGWTAIKYTKNYEVYDMSGAKPVLLDTLSSSAGSYSWDVTRGTSAKIAIKSVNDTGNSEMSNTLTLDASWDTPKILSATSDSKSQHLTFTFHKENGKNVTPDYGWPNDKIKLTVTNARTGAVAYTESNIKNAITYTPDFKFDRVLYYAVISVTSSTGENLGDSAPIEVDFPRPEKPSALLKNLTVTENGTAAITPNMLEWSEAKCSSDSTTEYQVTHDDYTSDWFTATTFDIPENLLTEGTKETFKVVSRCTNDNGSSDTSDASTVTFTTGLKTPDIPTNLTVESRGNHVSWSAVTCPANSSVEYMVYQGTRNGNNENGYSYGPIKTNSYDLAGLKPGTDQDFTVSARCVKYDSAGNVDASSVWSNQSDPYSWTTMYEQPEAVKLSTVGKKNTSTTQVEYTIRWTPDDRATEYRLYLRDEDAGSVDAGENDDNNDTPVNNDPDGTAPIPTDDAGNPLDIDPNGTDDWDDVTPGSTDNTDDGKTPLATYNGGTYEATVNFKRGTKIDVYMIAVNPDYKSPASNYLTLDDSWAKLELLEVEPDTYTGNIYVAWRKPNADGVDMPDFGDPDAKYQLIVSDTVTNEERVYNDLTGSNFTAGPIPVAELNPQTITLRVVTSTGETITATPKTVKFPPPGPPAKVTDIRFDASGKGNTDPNRISWKASVCGVGSAEYAIGYDGNNITDYDAFTTTSGRVYASLPDDSYAQGFISNYQIYARCVGPWGESDSSVSDTASTYIKINTPNAPAFINNGEDTISWSDDTSRPDRLAAEYRLTIETKNDKTSGQVITFKDATSYHEYVMDSLTANTTQTVSLEVRYYNPTDISRVSDWSPKNTQTWITPKPVPGTPKIVLSQSAKKDSKNQNYTISWSAVSWGEWYTVHNAATNAQIGGNVTGTSTVVTLTRGIDPTKIYVVAHNTSRDSDSSNELTLSAPWPSFTFKDAQMKRDGSVYIKWQDGTAANPTPDWGAPDSTVDITINKLGSGVVYTKTGLKTIDLTIPAGTITKDKEAAYIISGKLTTSTGVVMNTATSYMSFEQPTKPDTVANVNLDSNGTLNTPLNRVTWTAVKCTQANSVAEYAVFVESGGPAGANGEGARYDSIYGLKWFQGDPVYNLTADDLAKYQTTTAQVDVFARCAFTDTGDKGVPSDIIHQGAGTASLDPMVLPAKTPASAIKIDPKTDTLSWTKAVCYTGATPKYTVYYYTMNGKAYNKSVGTTTAVSLARNYTLTPDTAQEVGILTSCVTTDGRSSTNIDSASNLKYNAPYPKPDVATKPVEINGITYTDAKNASDNIGWTAAKNATQYVVYVNGTEVTRTTKTSYDVPIVRGKSVTVKVKAINATWTDADVSFSPEATFSAPYDPVDLSADDITISGTKIDVQWQEGAGASRTPNWGDDLSKVAITVKNSSGTTLLSQTGITTNTYSGTSTGFTANAKYTVTITVTSSNGDNLGSATVTVSSSPPDKPTGTPTGLKATETTSGGKPAYKFDWSVSAVKCAPGTTLQSALKDNKTSRTLTWGTATTITLPVGVGSTYWVQPGVEGSYSVVTRCSNETGVSALGTASAAIKVLNHPTPQGTMSLTVTKNDYAPGSAIVTASGLTCPTGYVVGYYGVYSKQNGTAVTPTTSNLKAFASNNTLTSTTNVDGEYQEVTAYARCSKGTATAEPVANYLGTDGKTITTKVNFKTPYKDLVSSAPKITKTEVKEGVINYTISWTDNQKGVENSTLYANGTISVGGGPFYSANLDTPVTMFPGTTGTTRTQVITLPRGGANATVRVELNRGDESKTDDIVLKNQAYPTVTVDAQQATENTQKYNINLNLSNNETGYIFGKSATAKVTIASSGETFTSSALNFTTGGTMKIPVTLTKGLTYNALGNITVTITDVNKKVITVTGKIAQMQDTLNKVTGLKQSDATEVSWNAVSCPAASTYTTYDGQITVVFTNLSTGSSGTTNLPINATSATWPNGSNGKAYTASVSYSCAGGETGRIVKQVSGSTVTNFTMGMGTAPAAAKSVTINTSKNTVTWTGSTCSIGIIQYTVVLRWKGGKSGTYYTTTTTSPTLTIPTTYRQPGETMKWEVTAGCKTVGGVVNAAAVLSGEANYPVTKTAGTSAKMTVSFNGYATYTIGGVSCPSGYTLLVQIKASKLNNKASSATSDWTTLSSSNQITMMAIGGEYGKFQNFTFYAVCAFKNADGDYVNGPSISKALGEHYTQPRAPQDAVMLKLGTGASSGYRYTAVCAIGTVLEYRWGWGNSSTTTKTATNPSDGTWANDVKTYKDTSYFEKYGSSYSYAVVNARCASDSGTSTANGAKPYSAINKQENFKYN